MPISYTIDLQQRVILESWVGPITVGHLREYWTRLMDDPLAMAIRRSVADLRGSDFQFSSDELLHLIQKLLVPKLHGLTWVSALVVDDPSFFGMGQQYQAYAQTFSQNQIFRGRAEAIDWALAQTL